MAYIQGAEKEGGKIVTGGKRWAGSEGGFYVEPTIIGEVTPDMTCVKEEVSAVWAGRESDEYDGVLTMACPTSDLWTGHLGRQVRDGGRSPRARKQHHIWTRRGRLHL